MTKDLLEQIKALGDEGYDEVRQLEDGTIIGLGKLIFTTAIYMDLNLYGYNKRYCFKDPMVALSEFEKIKTGDDIPEGWIAQRP